MCKKTVIDYLDEIHNKSKDNSLQYDTGKLNKEIFPNFMSGLNKDQSNIVKEKLTSDIVNSFNNISSKNRTMTPNKPLKTNINENKTNNDQLKLKLSSFNSNLDKLQDNISSDIKNQTNIFEEKKRNKMEKIKTCKGCIEIFNNYFDTIFYLKLLNLNSNKEEIQTRRKGCNTKLPKKKQFNIKRRTIEKRLRCY